MHLTFRDVDFESADDCAYLARWFNDLELKHLYSRFGSEEEYALEFTPGYFKRFGKSLPTDRAHRNQFALLDGEPVGQALFEVDPPKLITKTPNTAWVALMIGASDLRRQGLGRRMNAHIEELAVAAGAERFEIGVFAYNERALRFFESVGYVEVLRRPEFAWWDGRMWGEVRLLKGV